MNQDEDDNADEQTENLINEIEVKINSGGNGGGVMY